MEDQSEEECMGSLIRNSNGLQGTEDLLQIAILFCKTKNPRILFHAYLLPCKIRRTDTRSKKKPLNKRALNVTIDEVCRTLLQGVTGTELVKNGIKHSSKEAESKVKEHKPDGWSHFFFDKPDGWSHVVLSRFSCTTHEL